MKAERLAPFFRLLRLGLGTEKADGNVSAGFSSLSPSAWRAMYDLGVRQGVAAIQFDGLRLLPAEHLPDRALKMQWYAHTLQVERQCVKQYQIAAELAMHYAQQGVRTVVLKGIAAGENYPLPQHRPCGDLDCFLMGDYVRGNDIARELGASVDDHSYKHSHIEYNGLTVENHQYCTPVRGCKRTLRFERLLRGILRTESTTKIGETPLENPPLFFNALFLTYHGKSHFQYDGITLRHLCDWAMLLHQHGVDIDWAAFCAYAEEYGLRLFADAMTRLSNQILGVEVPITYRLQADSMRDEALLEEMLKGIPEPEGGSLWQQRMAVIKTLTKNKHRFDLFSDISYLHFLFNIIRGFFFDRHPQI